MNSAMNHDVFGFLEDLVDEAELEAIAQQPREQLRAELAARGADVRRVLAYTGKPRPLAKAPLAPVEPAKVIPIAKARPDRGLRLMRSISVAIAAGFFGIFVWKQGSMNVGSERPPRRELSDSRPTPTAPPSNGDEPRLQQAVQLRAEAQKLCDRGYWGVCQDRLDLAAQLDGAGDDTLAVHEMRNQIGPGLDWDRNGPASMFAKPWVGPGERPLRRHPR
jgi:hypothetical protein